VFSADSFVQHNQTPCMQSLCCSPLGEPPRDPSALNPWKQNGITVNWPPTNIARWRTRHVRRKWKLWPRCTESFRFLRACHVAVYVPKASVWSLKMANRQQKL